MAPKVNASNVNNLIIENQEEQTNIPSNITSNTTSPKDITVDNEVKAIFC